MIGTTAVASLGVCLSAAAIPREVGPTTIEVQENLQRIGLQGGEGDYAFRIPSPSMDPTLHCARPGPGCRANTADRVLVRPYSASQRPARGDVVAFTAGPRDERACGLAGTYIRRIVGMPGQKMFVDGDGFHLGEARPGAVKLVLVLPVPKGYYFLEGDNRGASCDSRKAGPVSFKYLVGRVVAIYWPTRRARRE